ncbi:hypothetical protein NDU88_003077 [Pleurodeles waltl]|uniref:Uncharacterized protein n=1 Tax=Pleurodeles waltl TaxID=8319 RepID=A0AAV7P8K8_PLEWA|nr:hypothetical protein NDU88_003077 [Pleurodeles waltl]
MQQPFRHASWCKMAAGGCNVTKEYETCGSGHPRQRRVRPVEQECSYLYMAQNGAKSQPAALLPQRRLGIVVRAPPGSVEFVLRSGNAATFSPCLWVQNGSQWLKCRKGVWGLWFGPPRQRRVRPVEQECSYLFTT